LVLPAGGLVSREGGNMSMFVCDGVLLGTGCWTVPPDDEVPGTGPNAGAPDGGAPGADGGGDGVLGAEGAAPGEVVCARAAPTPRLMASAPVKTEAHQNGCPIRPASARFRMATIVSLEAEEVSFE
jgi:hypothetical protein